MIADELEKLNQLRDQGRITEEDYQQAKQKILGAKPPSDLILGMGESTYCLVLHLTQFAGYLLPGAGMVVPVVLWLVGKDKSEEIDYHGRVILNWILSFLIYLFVGFLLCLVLVGFLLVGALILLGIIFPIVGAVRAADGRRWRYPMSIPFFSLPEA